MTINRIIVIGASLGGFEALRTILEVLPQRYPLPLAVVLHRNKDSGQALTNMLQKSSPLPVIEPEDKQDIFPGRVYIAPPDYHLLIEDDHFALSMDDPVNHARPSVDVLFESAASYYQDRVIGVILTGAGQDGAEGLAAIKAQGGISLVQDPETAEAPSMPLAALAASEVDEVIPLKDIGLFLKNL